MSPRELSILERTAKCLDASDLRQAAGSLLVLFEEGKDSEASPAAERMFARILVLEMANSLVEDSR